MEASEYSKESAEVSAKRERARRVAERAERFAVAEIGVDRGGLGLSRNSGAFAREAFGLAEAFEAEAERRAGEGA